MKPVISDEQRALNKRLHQENKDFGNRSDGAGLGGNLPEALIRLHQAGFCSSVLDYGTGKGKLVKRLRKNLPNSITVNGYDPAVEEWEKKPAGEFDILTCLDVLEHIEMTSIDPVLHDLKNLTKKFCYVVVDLQPAVKKLDDGRNAHILLAPPDWWASRFAQVFACQISFPIMHAKGVPQKLVITACDNRQHLPYMFKFLGIMRIFDFAMIGGPLGSV